MEGIVGFMSVHAVRYPAKANRMSAEQCLSALWLGVAPTA